MALILRRFLGQNIGAGSYKFLVFTNVHTSAYLKAGHSKWANIRHIKALKDGQKSIMYIKITRQIRLAIQEGGSANPALNSTLKYIIDDAVKKKMPMSTIQNTLKRFEQNKIQLKKYIFEMRQLNKIYMVCIAYTDNFPALKMNIATPMKKSGVSFVDSRHLFEDKGVIEVSLNDELLKQETDPGKLEEICTEHAIECGAEEVEVDIENSLVNFFCDPSQLERIRNNLLQKNYSINSAEHVFIPKVYITIPESDLKACIAFQEKLKAIDGIETIYTNTEYDIL